jgi:hypothetical protein
VNPKGKVYIGQSVDLYRRLKQYFEPNSAKNQTMLKNSFKKYGVNNHIFYIIEECNIEELNERERYWQEYYNVLSKSGLNCKMTTTLDKSGTLSDKTKKLIASKTKGTTKTCQSTMKKVYQYSNKGVFICEYVSLREAARQLNISATSISAAIKNRKYSNSAGGYLWSFEKLSFHTGYVGVKSKSIIQLTLDNVFIREFSSICSAAKELNLNKSGIIRCCKGKQKQCGGFIFKYKTNENI